MASKKKKKRRLAPAAFGHAFKLISRPASSLSPFSSSPPRVSRESSGTDAQTPIFAGAFGSEVGPARSNWEGRRAAEEERAQEVENRERVQVALSFFLLQN